MEQKQRVDNTAQAARELRETLANLCHEQWAGWMQYLFSKCYAEDWDGKPHPMTYIPTHLVERWMRQMTTPYAELSESEQDSDRTEADKFIKVFAAALATTRREAEREQMERDCAAVCAYCNCDTAEIDGSVYDIQPSSEEVGGWYHDLTSKEIDLEPVECYAAPIRAAYAARLRDGAGE